MNKLLPVLISISCVFALNACAAQASNEPVSGERRGSFLCAASELETNYNTPFLENFLRLQQGDDGWLYRDMDLKTSFGPNRLGYRQLQELQKALQQKGTTLVMVPIPLRAVVHPQYLGDIEYDVAAGQTAYQLYLHKLRLLNIVVPRLEQTFNHSQDKPLFFARDHHWNHRGARTVARLTAQALREAEDYRHINKQLFKSHVVASDHNKGSLQRAAKILCEQRFASEPFKVYHTESLEPLDPFADQAVPDVVLIGTSNSKGRLHFNFDGFLSHYTKTPVLNLAVSGGGFGESLKRYIQSDLFHESPPKFLVWELPSYYRLNDETYFQQLLAALGGDV